MKNNCIRSGVPLKNQIYTQQILLAITFLDNLPSASNKPIINPNITATMVNSIVIAAPLSSLGKKGINSSIFIHPLL